MQLEIPKELDKKIRIYKAKNFLIDKREVVRAILNKYFEQHEA
jgi:hypothetical protein